MELLVLATSLLRLLLVSAVYLLNIRALLRLTWQPRSCIHALTAGAVLLAGVLYLSSWAPYIAYTLSNGYWLLLGSRRHCLLQHFVAAETGAVLLALLGVRLMYRCLVQVYRRPLPSARAASLVTCLAWLGPQLLYDAVAITRDDTTPSPDSYRFLDDLLVVPQGVNASHGYRVGFMICMQLLSGPVLSYYVWQYVVLVLPLSALTIYCSGRLLVAAHTRKREAPPTDNAGNRNNYRMGSLGWSRKSLCYYGCKTNTFVDMALYYNFIWLVILRPLAILHALYMQSGEWGNAFYMDFGSHLVLAFSAVFSPFSVSKPVSDPPIESSVKTEIMPSDIGPSIITLDDSRSLPFDPRHVDNKPKEEPCLEVSVALKDREKTGEESVC